MKALACFITGSGQAIRVDGPGLSDTVAPLAVHEPRYRLQPSLPPMAPPASNVIVDETSPTRSVLGIAESFHAVPSRTGGFGWEATAPRQLAISSAVATVRHVVMRIVMARSSSIRRSPSYTPRLDLGTRNAPFSARPCDRSIPGPPSSSVSDSSRRSWTTRRPAPSRIA